MHQPPQGTQGSTNAESALHGSEQSFAALLKSAAQITARAPQPGTIAGDLLYGADAIAEFLFGDASKHRRRVYNLVANNRLPAFRVGANICARKSVLLAWIAKQETSIVGMEPGRPNS
jgi:hypothetical protein